MGKQVLLMAVIICTLLTITAVSSPASVGSCFADTYLAFAPLYTLYKSYANYLFSGTDLAIPLQVDQSCPRLLDSLEILQIEIITQTDSQRIEQLTRLASFRQTIDAFCQSYDSTISTIASLPQPELSVFKEAADAGFFAAISHENKALEHIFSSMLETYSNRLQWEFAVAFSTRTILKQEQLLKLDVSLYEILLGPKDNPYPPGTVPKNLLPQVKELATLAKEGIDPVQSERVIHLASQIYAWLMRET